MIRIENDSTLQFQIVLIPRFQNHTPSGPNLASRTDIIPRFQNSVTNGPNSLSGTITLSNVFFSLVTQNLHMDVAVVDNICQVTMTVPIYLNLDIG